MANGAFPDGIGETHLHNPSPARLRSRWFMLAVLGAILLAALFGVFGGQRNATLTASGPDATLHVDVPKVLRNGEFFEMRYTLEARRPLARPSIAVSQSYWRELTINTMIPAPAAESFDDGFYVFEFDPVDAGQSIAFKVDGQINPSLFGGTEGAVEGRDGERRLARIQAALRVFP